MYKAVNFGGATVYDYGPRCRHPGKPCGRKGHGGGHGYCQYCPLCN